MGARHLTIDGYLCTTPTPGPARGTAQFDLISSPTDDPADDTEFTCTTQDSHLTDRALTEIQPGDVLRVTGTLDQAEPLTGLHITVEALDVLAPAPARDLNEMVLERRYRGYAAVLDPGSQSVPVFTELGQWVGEAADIDGISDLIEAFESHPPAGAP